MQGMKSGLLLLLPPLALAGNQWNVTLPGGSMRFQGLIMASSCRVEAGDLLVDHARRDGQVRHLERRMRHEHGAPDGDATGNAETMQRKTHNYSPSPK